MTPDQIIAALTALGYGAYAPLVLAILGLASAIAAVVPPATTASPVAWRVLRAGLDRLGCNWGHAANATPQPTNAALLQARVNAVANPPS